MKTTRRAPTPPPPPKRCSPAFQKRVTALTTTLLGFKLTTQIFHWQTRQYSVHKTTDNLLDTLQKRTDELLEVIQGVCHTRLSFPSSKKHVYTFQNVNISSYTREIEKTIHCLIGLDDFINDFQKKSINGILNIRDELIGELQQTLYLLTFQ